MYPRLHIYIYIYSSLCYLPLRYVPNKNRGREAEREEKVVIFSYIDIVQRSKRSGNKPRRWKIKCLRFLFVPMLWREGGNIRKFERVGIDRTSGNYERRNGKGEDEGTTTSNSVRATKEENSCNKRSWTRANYFYRLTVRSRGHRRNNATRNRIVIVASPRCVFVHFLANIFVGSASRREHNPAENDSKR